MIYLLTLVMLAQASATYDWREKALHILSDLNRSRVSNISFLQPAAAPPPTTATTALGLDKFGVKMLFPSVEPDTDWYASWDQHRFMGKSNMVDPGDARGLSRGNGSLNIGDGEMIMDGGVPRYYVGAPAQGWSDTEFTVYCRVDRWLNRGKSSISLISRSRHHHIDKNPCDARGYYARFYFANHRVQLKKEFRHDANGSIIYSAGIESAKPLDSSFDIRSRYLGIKSVVTTNPDGNSVKLRMYFDLMEGKDGGNWQLLLDYDDVNLEALHPTGCYYEDGGIRGDSSPILRPGQVNFLRADAVRGLHLKSASIRAIRT